MLTVEPTHIYTNIRGPNASSDPVGLINCVVKVNSTNSTKTLETNLNGNKQIIPSERA